MNKKNAQTLNDAIRDFLASNNELRENMLISRAGRAWAEVLGQSVAHYTTSVYLKNKILHVSLSSSVLRNELILNRERLIENLNAYIGAPVIKDIIIR